MAHAKDDNTLRLHFDGKPIENWQPHTMSFEHSPREATNQTSAKFLEGKKSFTLDFNKLQPIDDKIMEGEIEYYYNRKGKYFFRTASGGLLTIIPIEPIKLKYGKYPAKIKLV